ncbi:uncharacterized protein LAESUDRAFT_741366 [Laetiporus sulphureus 93-53]|uniref:Uncharacterized protein n=1 Tax=Laetiporus sulphureus 93-53 TaxID=1314785 RepID=A0A165H0C5_9APHY|nr:uncharacterized protein LAESUDRAFT_741366 [Laetiporus sulphureus 93-53]KZT11075.1 hypothetical protein LAESUDRAFT_741366 [Laetiporus sulphureus 93-53]
MEGLARREIWRKESALQRIELSLQAQTKRLKSLESQLHVAELLALERELTSEEELSRLQAALTSARTEASDVQNRLQVEDVQSDADAVQLILDLNSEISQTAALLADAFRAEGVRSGVEFTAALIRAREAVGPIMAELLESIHHEEDPVLVHIALQADMVAFTSGIISAWDFQHQNNTTFAGIYKQMCKSESQIVSGHWRALTRRYSKQRLYNGRDLTEGFSRQLMERLRDILVVSGASIDEPLMRGGIYSKLETITGTALRLQQMMGEQIISHDLEVVSVQVDDVYNAEQMEDMSDVEGLAPDEQRSLHVLCTIALGLRRCTKPSGGLGDELQVTTLVKPGVILETLMYDLGLVEDEAVEDEAPSLDEGTES